MTVGMMENNMSASEFERWHLYYHAEPFGQARDNWHMGTLAALYMKVHGKAGSKPSADDFMYRSEDERRERSTRATISALKALAKPAQKAEPKRRRKGRLTNKRR